MFNDPNKKKQNTINTVKALMVLEVLAEAEAEVMPE
jgi:hypothetical protein